MKTINKSILIAVTILLSLDLSAQTNGTLTFTATTITQPNAQFINNNNYPNIVAIWVTNSTGTFVKTLKKMAGQRVQYLYQWKANSASNITDAITGSTLPNHIAHTVTWNCKNVSQVVVPDGDYKVWIEFSEGDYQGPYTSFTWTKGPNAQTLTPTNSKLSGISLTWVPIPASVSENSNSKDILVYPNPFSNQLNFAITNSTSPIIIQIFDITGRKVAFLERNIMELTTNIITWNGTAVNGERLKTGVYFYNITSGDKKYTGKVLLSN